MHSLRVLVTEGDASGRSYDGSREAHRGVGQLGEWFVEGEEGLFRKGAAEGEAIDLFLVALQERTHALDLHVRRQPTELCAIHQQGMHYGTHPWIPFYDL